MSAPAVTRAPAAWLRGERAVAGWLVAPSPLGAEVLATLGFDALILDLQHGAIDLADVRAIVPLLGATTPFVRVPSDEPATIMRVLDAGVEGVVCPLVDTREQAERFVAACRYPPAGRRSFGLSRGALLQGSEAYRNASGRAVLALAQIETVEAIANLEEIAATPGLDGILIGSVDLALSYAGVLPGTLSESPVREQIEQVVDACRRHDLRIALPPHVAADAELVREWGVDLVSVPSDISLLAAAARRALAEVRGE